MSTTHHRRVCHCLFVFCLFVVGFFSLLLYVCAIVLSWSLCLFCLFQSAQQPQGDLVNTKSLSPTQTKAGYRQVRQSKANTQWRLKSPVSYKPAGRLKAEFATSQLAPPQAQSDRSKAQLATIKPTGRHKARLATIKPTGKPKAQLFYYFYFFQFARHNMWGV